MLVTDPECPTSRTARGVYICNECVGLRNDIVREEEPQPETLR
ncbi:MAG: hypothetical protein ACRDZX_00080 [Acidimicrobiales bacterium]